MASSAMTRGAACPRLVSMDTTRHDWIKTAPVDTTLLKNMSLGTWHGTPAGLSQRRSGGLISRERRAWGSGNPELGNQPAGLG